MFKQELYNERIRFRIGATSYDYFVDNMTITLRKEQKRRVLSDYSVVRFFRGYHLDISIDWNWFRSFPGTSKENDIIFIYQTLLEDNQIVFIPNPEDAVPSEFIVRDSGDDFDIVNLKDKIRDGDFSLELETVDLLTDTSLIEPLGFQIV